MTTDLQTLEELLHFIHERVDDYGFQHLDTTCDWVGWFGCGIDTPSKWMFRADSFRELLEQMVERLGHNN